MKVNYELIRREIAGETILVPVGAAAMKFTGLITLNEMAAFIWDRIPEAGTPADITDAILKEYDVTREEADADVRELLQTLVKMEILDAEVLA